MQIYSHSMHIIFSVDGPSNYTSVRHYLKGFIFNFELKSKVPLYIRYSLLVYSCYLPCALGLALRNICNIFILQMALVVIIKIMLQIESIVWYVTIELF